jgi:hypothetical protein
LAKACAGASFLSLILDLLVAMPMMALANWLGRACHAIPLIAHAL